MTGVRRNLNGMASFKFMVALRRIWLYLMTISCRNRCTENPKEWHDHLNHPGVATLPFRTVVSK